MRWTTIKSLICVVVADITRSVNESTGIITLKKNQIFTYSLYYAQMCDEFAGPFAAALRWGNAAPFKEKSQRWRAVGNSVFNLTGSEFEHLTSRTRTEHVTA